MRPRVADLVSCPLDRTPLELVEWEAEPAALSAEQQAELARRGLAAERFDRHVKTGLLVNRARRTFYPIAQGVPRLLVFPTAAVRAFVEQHRDRLARELPGFAPPAEPGQPGEGEVLRTFSTEWLNYEWDGRAYWGQPAEVTFQTMRWALDLDHKELAGRIALEVGIGIGGIADYVTRSTGCELVGIDLSYAVDAAQRTFGANPFLHVVQASAFAPPFREGSFDFVYSQGVLHHTFSTRLAFESIARLPRPGGRLYVWVYSPYDERRTAVRRVLMACETVLRPVCSRLPDRLQTMALAPWAPLYMLNQWLQARREPGQAAAYGWREAIHAARDRFTPRFVYRHTDEEVRSWFSGAGFHDLVSLAERPAPGFVPTALVACTGVEGTRA